MFVSGLLKAVTKKLLADKYVVSARVLAINETSDALVQFVWLNKNIGSLDDPYPVDDDDGIQIGHTPSTRYPW